MTDNNDPNAGTDEGAPHAMTRRQLIRHSAWFGAAVGLAVVGGEVISHVAGGAGGGEPFGPAGVAVRSGQRQSYRIHRNGQP